MVTVEDVREFARGLPRSYEAYVRGRLKLRVGNLVYASFSPDGTIMGFGFPREWRPAAIDAEPDKFLLPSKGDLRYNWLLVRLAAIDEEEMRDLILEAWRMCVPKRVGAEYDASIARATQAHVPDD